MSPRLAHRPSHQPHLRRHRRCFLMPPPRRIPASAIARRGRAALCSRTAIQTRQSEQGSGLVRRMPSAGEALLLHPCFLRRQHNTPNRHKSKRSNQTVSHSQRPTHLQAAARLQERMKGDLQATSSRAQSSACSMKWYCDLLICVFSLEQRGGFGVVAHVSFFFLCVCVCVCVCVLRLSVCGYCCSSTPPRDPMRLTSSQTRQSYSRFDCGELGWDENCVLLLLLLLFFLFFLFFVFLFLLLFFGL